MTTIGIIIGSTRPGRVGADVAAWVAERARRTDVEVDLVDLATLGLPFLDEPEPAASGIYRHEHTRAWARRVRSFDAVVLVTAEYNGAFPAPLKNALDFLGPEWANLPATVVAYGNSSSGSRAATALLPVLVGLGMLPAGPVLLGLRDRLTEHGLAFLPHDDAAVASALDRLLGLAHALEPLRITRAEPQAPVEAVA
ncbi:hypothetical protein GCM10023221_14240 [Luteimicrobium xylanilyticum]|uniref:NAD(P)H-dependent FMN reductase n=1 Tax=Luteimicrobium xylanilyticum TaxID=1133546 RepID=A0A5P9QF87_9MICO|nr:NAD(P)H-dependent oxidoreductase [Luteimicrobium xylanilyticum]QFU99105.1 NAD(P)H-dependent FMN reductase [Luteimicrobium xylanilyticum]